MNNDQAKEYGQMLSLRGNLPGRFNQFYDFVEVTAATLNDWSDEINFKEKALPIVKNVVMFIKYCSTILPLDVGNNMNNIAKKMKYVQHKRELITSVFLEKIMTIWLMPVKFCTNILID